jgi:hypothetical protein
MTIKVNKHSHNLVSVLCMKHWGFFNKSYYTNSYGSLNFDALKFVALCLLIKSI